VEVSPVLAFERFIPIARGRLIRSWRPECSGRHKLLGPRQREGVRAALPALCIVGIAAAAGWILALGGGGVGVGVGVGESLPTIETLLSRHHPAAAISGGTPIHIGSSPVGAQVRIDGASAGTTPLDTRVSPGQHELGLQHPDTLDDVRTLQVTNDATSIDVGLWRRGPDVVAIRPVYPGSSLLDARFLDDGRLALLVGVAGPSSKPGRGLWLLDPPSGQLARLEVPGLDSTSSSMVLAPAGDQLAYVVPGSSVPVTATGWSTAASVAKAATQKPGTDSVWVVPLNGNRPPHRIYELPSVTTAAVLADERIVDLVWTPDASRLVAITRQTGPPVRARIVLLSVPPPDVADTQVSAAELVLLPAEVLPDSATVDPGGRWLALVTHVALAGGGSNPLSLCVLELEAGGLFRDVADLGAGATLPVTAPVAWPPAAAPGAHDRLIFVRPAPASANNGLFGLFGALRPSAPPSGLFTAALPGSGLEDLQPRRLGSAINNFGLVWRFPGTLYGFAREDSGALALHSIDPTSGTVRDLGVRLPPGTAQGTTGLSVRWDALHGNALLVAHASDGGTPGASAGGDPLQAWLVSFASPGAPAVPVH
jgi:hypothetical protein